MGLATSDAPTDADGLTPADRLDLAVAALGAVRAEADRLGGAVAGALDALARDLAAGARGEYVQARVAGLCHEGALEAFRDAVARAARSALEAGVSRS
jgi:hypothetical protein